MANETDAVHEVRIKHLENELENYRKQLATLDAKYVRLERYIIFERSLLAIIGVILAAFGGLVWKIATKVV